MIIRQSNYLKYQPPIAVATREAATSFSAVGRISAGQPAMLGGTSPVLGRTNSLPGVTDPHYGIVDSGNGFAPALVLTSRATRVLHKDTLQVLSLVPGALGPVYSGSLTSPLMMSQFEDELKKAYPGLGAGYQIVSVGFETWSCYKKFRGPNAAGVVPRTFCAVSVVFGVIDLLGIFIPAVKSWTDSLTVVHLVWSTGEGVYEMAVKGSEPAVRPFLGKLGSQPGMIQAVGMHA
jgi:hypothetical protein